MKNIIIGSSFFWVTVLFELKRTREQLAGSMSVTDRLPSLCNSNYNPPCQRLDVQPAEAHCGAGSKKAWIAGSKKKSEILLIMSGTVTGISEDMDRQIVQVSDPTDLDSTGLVDNGSRLTLTERALTLILNQIRPGFTHISVNFLNQVCLAKNATEW